MKIKLTWRLQLKKNKNKTKNILIFNKIWERFYLLFFKIFLKFNNINYDDLRKNINILNSCNACVTCIIQIYKIPLIEPK